MFYFQNCSRVNILWMILTLPTVTDLGLDLTREGGGQFVLLALPIFLHSMTFFQNRGGGGARPSGPFP